MKFKNPTSVAVKIIAAAILVGALGRHSYDYYTILRWVVCGVSAFSAFQAVESGKNGWAWAFTIVALAFNPIIPVHLKRESWTFVNLAVAAFLLVSIAAIDRQKPPTPPI